MEKTPQKSASVDEILDQTEKIRGGLIKVALETAQTLARKNGKVNSNDVFNELVRQGYSEALRHIDKRFMGAIFRTKNGWEHCGYVNRGSHQRPISVWKIRDAS